MNRNTKLFIHENKMLSTKWWPFCRGVGWGVINMQFGLSRFAGNLLIIITGPSPGITSSVVTNAAHELSRDTTDGALNHYLVVSYRCVHAYGMIIQLQFHLGNVPQYQMNLLGINVPTSFGIASEITEIVTQCNLLFTLDPVRAVK